MTSSYAADFAIARYGRLLRLLKRWRASVYKVIMFHLVIYLATFYAIHLTYFFALDSDQQGTFEAIAAYCSKYLGIIPMSFILGFFVGEVVKRWWNIYLIIPWPDPVALLVSSLIIGTNEAARMMRRTIIRYLNLAIIITLMSISKPIRKRFNTDQKLIEFGLMNQNEADILNKWNDRFPKLSRYYMPIVWACSICIRARHEGMIRDDFTLNSLLVALNNSRQSCHTLYTYDLIPIPLVYTQVVTLVCYTYFLICLLAHQFDNYHFPLFLIMEFIIYMGLLKAAETIINPFGDDDEDYELNWLIDRHMQIGYLIVDEMQSHPPTLVKDVYFDLLIPDTLPYGKAKFEKPPDYSLVKPDPTLPKRSPRSIFLKQPKRITTNPSYEESATSLKSTKPLRPSRKVHFNDSFDSSSNEKLIQRSIYIEPVLSEEDLRSEASSSILSYDPIDAFDILSRLRYRRRLDRQVMRYLPLNLNALRDSLLRYSTKFIIPIRSTKSSNDSNHSKHE